MGSVLSSSSQQVVIGIRAVLLGSNVPAAITPPRSDAADSSFQLTVSNGGQTPDGGTLESPEDGTMVSSMQLCGIISASFIVLWLLACLLTWLIERLVVL